MRNNDALSEFVSRFTMLIDRAENNEKEILASGAQLVATLISTDDWLDEEFARADPRHYVQYLLYCDPTERFSVVSFVWGPGQKTPVHDHTVWGIIGMLRGAERSERFTVDSVSGSIQPVDRATLLTGEVDRVSPAIGDIHRVSNVYDDQVSVSIHVYGANIGKIRRNIYDPETGHRKAFISGFANVLGTEEDSP